MKLIFPFLIFLLIACSSEIKKNKDTKVFSIQLTEKKDFLEKNVKLSNFVDSISYIKLEYTPQSIISAISDIRSWKNHYLILDKMTSSIFIFNKKGDFIRKIHKVGKGPQEYLLISAFDVNLSTGDISIYDPISKKMLIYSQNGEFQYTFPLDAPIRDFRILLPSGDYIFYLPDYNMGYVKRGLWKTDDLGKFKEHLIHIDDEFDYGGIYPKYFCRINKNKIGLLGNEDKDLVYHITDHGIKAAYWFDIDMEIPDKFKGHETLNPQNYPGTVYTKNSYHETKGLLIVNFSNFKNTVTLAYDKKNKKRFPDLKKVYNDIDSIYGAPTMTALNNSLIYKLPITKVLSSKKLKNKFGINSINVNPILQIHHLNSNL